MRKTTLTLVNGEELAGYEVCNFVVYKDYYYWQVAHKSGYKLPGYFARRKDAARVCQAADTLADWDFDEPFWEIGEATEGDTGREYRAAYVEACAHCISDRSILQWADQADGGNDD